MTLKTLIPEDRHTIYSAIVYAIEHGYRDGFHNSDPEHPVYQGDGTCSPHADGPDRSALYKLLHELSAIDAKSSDHVIDMPVMSWSDYSKLIQACRKKFHANAA